MNIEIKNLPAGVSIKQIKFNITFDNNSELSSNELSSTTKEPDFSVKAPMLETTTEGLGVPNIPKEMLDMEL